MVICLTESKEKDTQFVYLCMYVYRTLNWKIIKTQTLKNNTKK